MKVTMADWEVTPRQTELVNQVLQSGRLTYGPMTRKLEQEFARIHGRKHALFTNSGTSALKISLGALKERHRWKDGDEVIIPSVTFVATMNAVIMNNLKPVIVDVYTGNVNLNPKLIEEALTERTVAIMPVHLLGQPCKMTEILEIAKEHNLRVVEDSCETMFVKKEGKPVGSQGDIACFSSYLAHLLVTGVGGFITTNDDELATVMRSMMFHGRDESYLTIDDNNKTGEDRAKMIAGRFHFPRFGYSDRSTELEAALGVADLENWPNMITLRQRNAEYLMHELQGVVKFPIEKVSEHAFMFFPFYAERRDELILYLEEGGIHTRTMMPLTTQPLVQPYLQHDYPSADYVNAHGVLIGCHQYLEKEDLDYIVKTIKEFY